MSEPPSIHMSPILVRLWHDILVSVYYIKNLNPLFMRKTIGLLLAAAAAFGLYRYSKMTPQQKKDLREKGKDIWDKKVSNVLKKRTAGSV